MMGDRTDKMSFAAVCPNGHNPTLVFDTERSLKATLRMVRCDSIAFFVVAPGFQAKKSNSGFWPVSPKNPESDCHTGSSHRQISSCPTASGLFPRVSQASELGRLSAGCVGCRRGHS
jgi:hypothetical protein